MIMQPNGTFAQHSPGEILVVTQSARNERTESLDAPAWKHPRTDDSCDDVVPNTAPSDPASRNTANDSPTATCSEAQIHGADNQSIQSTLDLAKHQSPNIVIGNQTKLNSNIFDLQQTHTASNGSRCEVRTDEQTSSLLSDKQEDIDSTADIDPVLYSITEQDIWKALFQHEHVDHDISHDCQQPHAAASESPALNEESAVAHIDDHLDMLSVRSSSYGHDDIQFDTCEAFEEHVQTSTNDASLDLSPEPHCSAENRTTIDEQLNVSECDARIRDSTGPGCTANDCEGSPCNLFVRRGGATCPRCYH